MSFKTILVCLTTEANAERLMKAACHLAGKFDAHLIGLHTRQAMLVHPGVAVHLTPESIQAFHDAQTRQAEQIHEVFKRETAKVTFANEWRLVNADAGSASEQIVEQARRADLVVMSQADPEHDRADQSDIQRDVIQGSGRPVIVIPNIGEYNQFGDKIMIGWSATREATRALHDAIPFVRDHGEATVMWVTHSEKDADYLGQSAAEVASGLERHGIRTTVTPWQNADIKIGDALLNEASENGADMIVTGAFGHSRFYDFAIGATTTHLLKHMTVPVLFSN